MIDYSQFNFEFLRGLGGLICVDSSGLKDNHLYDDELYQGLIKRIDAYYLFENKELYKYNIIIFPYDIDQILLYDNQTQIKKFLDSGKIILNFTQTYLEYLPKLPKYIVSKTPIKDRNILTMQHSITRGVKDYDITYRRGVKGFFSRGFIEPPLGAEIFIEDSDGECVAYADASSFNGLLIHTAGADLLGFGLFENSTSKRLGLNLLLYLEKYLRNKK